MKINWDKKNCEDVLNRKKKQVFILNRKAIFYSAEIKTFLLGLEKLYT